MITTSLFYILMLLFLLGTCYMEKQRKNHIVAKTLTSFGFIVLAIVSLYCSRASMYFFALLPGFIFCLSGDIFLAVRSMTKKFKWFVWGLIMFALAHLSFIFSLQKYTPWHWWDFVIPIASMILVYFIFKLPSIDSRKGRILCIFYSYFVTLFVIKAVECMIVWDASMQGVFLAIGAISFCISDFMLIFLYFSKKEFLFLQVGNLTTYYLGVGLIASSIYFG